MKDVFFMAMTKSESNRSYYETCKRLHKCVRCGNQDARTLISKPLCFDCLEKKRSEMKGVNQSKSQLKIKDKCIQNGICTRCKKRKTESGYKTCKYCRSMNMKRYYDKRSEQGLIRRSEAKEYGLCSICLTNPRYKTYNTCFECYQYVVNKFKDTRKPSKWETIIKSDIYKTVNL